MKKLTDSQKQDLVKRIMSNNGVKQEGLVGRVSRGILLELPDFVLFSLYKQSKPNDTAETKTN